MMPISRQSVQAAGRAKPAQVCLIEGYASRFGVADLAGDVIRPGAFSRTLRQKAPIDMLLQHSAAGCIGKWLRLAEDAHGLFVRGLVENLEVCSMILAGLNGLSIGFRPRLWQPLSSGGRRLIEIELVEISLVAEPMLKSARFDLI